MFAQNLLGIEEPMLGFDIVLHLGTLTAVFLFFAKDIYLMASQTFIFLFKLLSGKSFRPLTEEYPSAVTAGYVILGTLPVVGIGLTFKDSIEHFFGPLIVVAIAWTLMGILLILSRCFQSGQRPIYMMNHQDAFLIGIAQAIAIFPGISRSGMTIMAGMKLGIAKSDAARFSFLLSIPAILGAAVLQLKDGFETAGVGTQALVVGFVVSAVTGYLAILLLLKLVQKGSFFLFGFYCLAMGIFAFVVRFVF